MDNKVSVILQGLNDEQRQAVQCVDGPVLIVAGAGSGKTRVLTSRVAYILAGGEDPSRILALTFTKKAAGEMKERIAMMVGGRAAWKVVMGTFHSVFVRFLREYAASLGYPEQFTIYDTSDSQSAMKTCIKELGLDDKVYKPRDVLSRISIAKNNLITVTLYRANQNLIVSDQHAKKPRICDLYELYQQKLKAAGVMDFDDILVNMNVLLRDNKEALHDIASRFSYIMVDEYQDTNFAQYLIIKKLAEAHRNICVVGDDSQSIYAFRGAKIENILNFKKDYPECRLFRLERNYRSTRNIVNAANSVIAKNEGRIPKECYSEAEDGDRIRIIKTYSELEEAVMIVSGIIERMRTGTGIQYQDFAVLYRTNSQSRAIEEQLRRKNLPYMIYSGNSFFERAEVKDMMAYFKLCVNPSDNESFKRVVNKPARGIGDTTLGAVEQIARAENISLYEAGFRVPKVQGFCEMIKAFNAESRTADAHDLALRIADRSGLYAFYKADTSIEGMSRTANVEELLNSITAYIEEVDEEAEYSADTDTPVENIIVTLSDFLENVSLLSNVDTSDNDEDTNNKIALMTIHSAKGLEFPYVFVAGMEENLFPSLTMLSNPAELEEERRLFYVALTRAKKAVGLSYAVTRMRNGKHESNAPSRFLKEIDARYLENPLEDDFEDYTGSAPERSFGGFGSRFSYGQSSRATYEKRKTSFGPAARPSATPVAPPVRKPDIIDPDFVAVPMTELYVGERVEHNRFGAGTIKSISGTAPEMKAVIDFDSDQYGEKLLLLKYAKLRPLKR